MSSDRNGAPKSSDDALGASRRETGLHLVWDNGESFSGKRPAFLWC